MPFRADDKNLAHLTKMLPGDAMSIWCEAASNAELEGLDHNECVKAAWGALKEAGWCAPTGPNAKKWYKPKKPKEDDEEEDGDKRPKTKYDIVKYDDELGIAWGWASVISVKGEPYVDVQGDIIEGNDLVKATTEFMEEARIALAMHERDALGGIPVEALKGLVVHSFPMVGWLMKSLGIRCDMEGWIVGVAVKDEETKARIKSGELMSFSIGGSGDRVPA